jgi:YegS/Rv2252/BmrU family lipid kinase
MRVHVVANPVAGRGRVPALLEGLARELSRRGVAHDVYLTKAPRDATAHVASLAPDAFDRLAVIGGDGTLHEVVNGLDRLPWPVAVVPVGTANLVGREASVPLRGDAVARADGVLGEGTRVVDLLDTDRGRTLAVVGVGLDAEVVCAVARARGLETGGYTRWLLPLARTITTYAPPRLVVRVDGEPPLEAGAVIVQNAFNYGGLFTLSSRARMDDGLLDVVVLKRARKRDFVRMLARAFAGGLDDEHGARILRGTRVRVESRDPALVEADGDPAGSTPLSVRLLPKALTLVTPKP